MRGVRVCIGVNIGVIVGCSDEVPVVGAEGGPCGGFRNAVRGRPPGAAASCNCVRMFLRQFTVGRPNPVSVAVIAPTPHLLLRWNSADSACARTAEVRGNEIPSQVDCRFRDQRSSAALPSWSPPHRSSLGANQSK